MGAHGVVRAADFVGQRDTLFIVLKVCAHVVQLTVVYTYVRVVRECDCEV